MMLVLLISILIVGGLLAWIVGRVNEALARVIALIALGVNFIWIVSVWITDYEQITVASGDWLYSFKKPWISSFGINWHFAMDGLSLLLITLTFFLGIISVLVSWNQIKEKVGFYHFNLLWILAGITGVFLAMDLFLFYFFWEIMLIPMYFIIGIWGHENRVYASIKFFIFTQASGLLMFLAILCLYFIYGEQSGVYTFDYEALLGTTLSSFWSYLIMTGFLIAFIVKLPAVPFHSWLPDAHTEAPTAGSIILAGLLLKTGAYGLLRFVVPLFPDAAIGFAPFGMCLGVISILYGAKLAFAQTDLKRMVAYTSVSHMGFILLGVFSFNALAYQGVVIQIITHGVSTGALFILVGYLQHRFKTRNIEEFSGLWSRVPKMGAMGLLFAMASLGLPGLGNFIGEFLILVGAFQVSVLWTVLASVGLISATIYALRLFQKVFQREEKQMPESSDLNIREILVMGSLTVVIFWLGLYPGPVLETSSVSTDRILRYPVEASRQVPADSANHKVNTSAISELPEISDHLKSKEIE